MASKTDPHGIGMDLPSDIFVMLFQFSFRFDIVGSCFLETVSTVCSWVCCVSHYIVDATCQRMVSISVKLQLYFYVEFFFFV